MKKIIFWLLMLHVIIFTGFTKAYAIQQIIIFDETTPRETVYNNIEKQGGRIIRKFDYITAVVVEFPVSDINVLFAQSEDIKTPKSSLREIGRIYPNKQRQGLFAEQNSHSAASAPLTREEYAARLGEKMWGIDRLNVRQAWTVTRGNDIKVAVIDTGADITHRELSPNIAGTYNAIHPDQPPLDDNGHGTKVAGVIAAIQDGKGVVGVAPKIKLYIVKAVDKTGDFADADFAAAIDWCIKQKIQVINMSFGSEQPIEVMELAVKTAYKAGITMICAPGNGNGTKAVAYPAGYGETIAVNAMDSSEAGEFFTGRSGPQIALIAPGNRIISTAVGDWYDLGNGTSFAAPHVAGIAAMVIAAGIYEPSAVRQALVNAAAPLPKLERNLQGAGIIDAFKAVRNLSFQSMVRLYTPK